MGATLNDRRALDADYHGLSNNQKNSNRTHRVGPCFLNQPSPDPKAAQCHYDMWQDKAQAPPEIIDSLYYSANVFAARAIEKINARATGAPLYIHLTWQNVHAPSVSAFSPCPNLPPPPPRATTEAQPQLRLPVTEPFDVLLNCDRFAAMTGTRRRQTGRTSSPPTTSPTTAHQTTPISRWTCAATLEGC